MRTIAENISKEMLKEEKTSIGIYTDLQDKGHKAFVPLLKFLLVTSLCSALYLVTWGSPMIFIHLLFKLYINNKVIVLFYTCDNKTLMCYFNL